MKAQLGWDVYGNPQYVQAVMKYYPCSAGQRVAKGEVVALVGQTGRVTGPHLHLNVEIDGVLRKPREYIN